MSVSLWVAYGHRVFHYLSLIVILLFGLAALAYTLACALGFAPWMAVTITIADVAYAEAGMVLQTALTALLVSLFFFMPSAGRIIALETSHRNFHISMHDVARAYHLCHTADRGGVFTMSSEFDAVRERIAYLRDHPDLEQLEPAVLEVAAQMSQQARELADIYSDEKIARAKTFLTQRQQEVERQQALIVEANHAMRDIRKWSQQVEIEESIIASQLSQLEEQLESALPELGFSLGRNGAEIVPLAQMPAAE